MKQEIKFALIVAVLLAVPTYFILRKPPCKPWSPQDIMMYGLMCALRDDVKADDKLFKPCLKEVLDKRNICTDDLPKF